jgi:hypothetical protein
MLFAFITCSQTEQKYKKKASHYYWPTATATTATMTTTAAMTTTEAMTTFCQLQLSHFDYFTTDSSCANLYLRNLRPLKS